MKNKILTSILISCITLAAATTQPCYAAEEQHVSEHSEEHARTAEDPDHHAEPAPEETASIQEGQGELCHRRRNPKEAVYSEALHHLRRQERMRSFKEFYRILHFQQETEPGLYMCVIW